MAGADDDQIERVDRAAGIIVVQIEESAGGGDVVNQPRQVIGRKVGELDLLGQAVLRPGLAHDGKIAVDGDLPKLLLDAKTVAVAAKIEGQNGVSFGLQRLGQADPTALLAIVTAAQIVQHQHARPLFALRPGIQRTDQFHVVHRGERDALPTRPVLGRLLRRLGLLHLQLKLPLIQLMLARHGELSPRSRPARRPSRPRQPRPPRTIRAGP